MATSERAGALAHSQAPACQSKGSPAHLSTRPRVTLARPMRLRPVLALSSSIGVVGQHVRYDAASSLKQSTRTPRAISAAHLPSFAFRPADCRLKGGAAAPRAGGCRSALRPQVHLALSAHGLPCTKEQQP
eukprot:6214013-Pleurochrysis_carterae.AAC.5